MRSCSRPLEVAVPTSPAHMPAADGWTAGEELGGRERMEAAGWSQNSREGRGEGQGTSWQPSAAAPTDESKDGALVRKVDQAGGQRKAGLQRRQGGVGGAGKGPGECMLVGSRSRVPASFLELLKAAGARQLQPLGHPSPLSAASPGTCGPQARPTWPGSAPQTPSAPGPAAPRRWWLPRGPAST